MFNDFLKVESAYTQKDIGFIDELIVELRGMREHITTLADANSLSYQVVINTMWYKKHTENINKILKTRFGITYKMVSNEYSTDMGTLVVPPPRYNIYKGDELAEMYKLNKSLSEKEVDVSKINDYDRDYRDMDISYIKSMKALDEKLRTDNVYIDYNEAKIYNLPDNYLVYLLWNPMLLSKMSGVEFTLRSIVFGIVHEVGHTFDTLDTSFRSARCMVDVMDSIKSEVDLKGGKRIDGVRLAYENITGEESDGKKILTMVMGIMTHAKSDYGYDKGKFSIKSGERMADGFANQFGLGPDYVDFVNTYKEITGSLPSMGNNSRATMVAVAFSTWMILILPGVWAILGIYVMVITVLSAQMRNEGADVYDDPRRRLIKLKQNLIQQLKNISKDKNSNIKSMKDRIKNDIEAIEQALQLLNEDKGACSNASKAFKKASSGERVSLNYLIDDLMNNDLHYLVEKI